jgi:hypothetical protein
VSFLCTFFSFSFLFYLFSYTSSGTTHGRWLDGSTDRYRRSLGCLLGKRGWGVCCLVAQGQKWSTSVSFDCTERAYVYLHHRL